jgi:hypothetical protein
LLELKSRLLLNADDDELLDFEPGEAARSCSPDCSRRPHRQAAEHLEDTLAHQEGGAYRCCARCRRSCAV